MLPFCDSPPSRGSRWCSASIHITEPNGGHRTVQQSDGATPLPQCGAFLAGNRGWMTILPYVPTAIMLRASNVRARSSSPRTTLACTYSYWARGSAALRLLSSVASSRSSALSPSDAQGSVAYCSQHEPKVWVGKRVAEPNNGLAVHNDITFDSMDLAASHASIACANDGGFVIKVRPRTRRE